MIVVSPSQPPPLLVLLLTVAVALVAVTAVRTGGHWLYQLAVLHARFRYRARAHELTEGDDKAGDLLGVLLPGSSVRAVETGQEPAFAVSHPGGMTAIVRPDAVTPALMASFPLPSALLPDGHDFGVQTVFHVGARPDTPPRLWLALLAARTVDSPDDEDLAVALRNGLRRVRHALRRAGMLSEPLSVDAALDAITALAHVTGGRNGLREDWRFWRTGGVSQACFTMDGCARLAVPDLRKLVPALLSRTPGVARTVTLHARSGAGPAVTEGLLRLASTAEAMIDTVADQADNLLSRQGVHLVRLDGSHRSGVAASLPIGGFPR
jgi:ESX secretion system protein EccE